MFGGVQRLLIFVRRASAKRDLFARCITSARGARGIPVSLLAECARAQHDGNNRGSMQVHKLGGNLGVVLRLQEEDGRRT